jgi:glycosyltransferase involved in cell wall biosynthesis
MHIALAAQEYSPEFDLGGIGAYTRHLATGLRQLDQRVTLLSGSMNTDRLRTINASSVRGAGWRGLRKALPISSFRALSHSLYLRRQVNNLVSREALNMVEVPDWGAEGFALARHKPRPLAIKLHTPLFVIDRYDKQPQSLDRLMLNWLEKQAILKADLLTSPSLSLAGIVAQQYHIPLKRIHILPYPIDDKLFMPATQSNYESSTALTVLYVGRLNKRKGIYTLAQAIPRVAQASPKVIFLFVGPDMSVELGGGTHQQELVKQLAQQPNQARVHFLPTQTREQLVSLYQASTVCVVPSLYDNLPFACLEAMACGKPVIASAVGGLAEIITSGQNGLLVPPDDPEALADQLIGLLRDQERRRHLGQQARAYIEENLSCARIAQATLDLYAAIVH